MLQSMGSQRVGPDLATEQPSATPQDLFLRSGLSLGFPSVVHEVNRGSMISPAYGCLGFLWRLKGARQSICFRWRLRGFEVMAGLGSPLKAWDVYQDPISLMTLNQNPPLLHNMGLQGSLLSFLSFWQLFFAPFLRITGHFIPLF